MTNPWGPRSRSDGWGERGHDGPGAAALSVVAPGKLLLTGAYAVLEGAPALVVAVDRRARARFSGTAPSPLREVAAAFAGKTAPQVEGSAFFDTLDPTKKLGIGFSAAGLVAALGLEEAAHGADLAAPETRRRLFERAWEVHGQVQEGGSGVDIAASVMGGLLRYERTSSGASWRAVVPPAGFHWAAYFSGASARTQDLRARVEAFRMGDAGGYRVCMKALAEASLHAAETFEAGDLDGFLQAAGTFRDVLAELGARATTPIVTPEFERLHRIAREEGAVFLPSGAGGGDVALYLGRTAPSSRFSQALNEGTMKPLLLGTDPFGVRVETAKEGGWAHSHNPRSRDAGPHPV